MDARLLGTDPLLDMNAEIPQVRLLRAEMPLIQLTHHATHTVMIPPVLPPGKAVTPHIGHKVAIWTKTTKLTTTLAIPESAAESPGE
jgi:hypothetical protein